MFTHLLMLSPAFREILFACPTSPWNLPSFTVESTLSSQCSRSNPLFFAKVWLLLSSTLSHIIIWCSEQMALFIFLLKKAALASFPTADFVVLRPLFSAGPVCSNCSAEAYAILLALHWSQQHQQVRHFFSPTLALSSPTCPLLRLSFYFKLSGRSCLFFPPLLSVYNGSPDIHFLWGTMRLMSWPYGEH